MANAEISILGREAHAIESTRSTFCLQSLMLILIRSIYLFATSYLRESACVNPLIPWPTSFHCFQSHLLRAIYFHLQFTLLVLYFTCYLLYIESTLVIALTIIISISSPSPHHHHLHLHNSNPPSPSSPSHLAYLLYCTLFIASHRSNFTCII